MSTTAARTTQRIDSAANWTSTNPILALGEIGVETITYRIKVGDGSTAWNSLAYATISSNSPALTGTATLQTAQATLITAQQATLTSASIAALTATGTAIFATSQAALITAQQATLTSASIAALTATGTTIFATAQAALLTAQQATLTSASIASLTATGLTTLAAVSEGVNAAGIVNTTATLSISASTEISATLTANATCTFTMPPVAAGKSFQLLLKQPAVTGNGAAIFTGARWTSGTAPTITTTAGRMDILSFKSDGTNWYGSFVQNFTY